MADEPIREPQTQTDDDRARSNRGMFGLVGVLLVIVIVVLMFLLFRGCDSRAASDADTSGERQIVPVEGLSAEPGAVSAWVRQGTDINSLLKVTGLEDSTITDMGGGRFVISVPPGTEDTVVRILAEIDGVYDAGLVYELGR